MHEACFGVAASVSGDCVDADESSDIILPGRLFSRWL